MDRGRNPFVPGAGTRPPELAGRSEVVDDVRATFQRLAGGRPAQPPVFFGLRGVGKTVLLRGTRDIAEEDGLALIYVEASDGKSLPALLVPGIRAALLELSAVQAASVQAKRALGALKAFISGFKLSYGGFDLSYDATAGVADTGDIEVDVPDLLVELGKAAKSAGRVVAIFFDEMQILRRKEFGALIMAMHRINQEALPVGFVGAGLPQVLGLAGNAKSYAERLFKFVPIGALPEADATAAIEQPARALNVTFEQGAVSQILEATQRYPYFLQQWAHDAWNVARDEKTITWSDVLDATDIAHRALDQSFFKVRYDRCSAQERQYMRGMAELGQGAHASADIANIIGVDARTASRLRGMLIKKSMIYSSTDGLSFTVPLFDEFMRRAIPNFVAKSR